MTDPMCGCTDAEGLTLTGSKFTGVLCTRCYAGIRLRVGDLTDLIVHARAEMNPLQGTQYGDKVQTSSAPRLPYREDYQEAAAELYATAANWAVFFSRELTISPPPHLARQAAEGRTIEGLPRAGAHRGTVHDVESWLLGNLWLIVAHPEAVHLTTELGGLLRTARQRWFNAPLQARPKRGKCRSCLSDQITIILGSEGFAVACGGCGRRIRVEAEAVVRALAYSTGNDDSAGSVPAHGRLLEGRGNAGAAGPPRSPGPHPPGHGRGVEGTQARTESHRAPAGAGRN